MDPQEEALWEEMGATSEKDRDSMTLGDAYKEQNRYNGRAIFFWLAWFPLVFGIPTYLSNRHDRKLVELAEGKTGVADSILKRFSFAGLRERIGDRALLEAVWRHKMADDLGKGYKSLMSTLAVLPQEAKVAVSRAYLSIGDRFLNLPTGQMSVVPIIAVNTLVFLGWRVAALRPHWQKFMYRHFTDSMSWKRPWTPYLSSFSHQSLGHFAFNQIALWSVGSFALETLTQKTVDRLSTEQGGRPWDPPEVDYKYQAFAAFLFCATLGAMASRVFSRASVFGGAFRMRIGANAAQARFKVQDNILRHSLGSSAGVYGLFAVSAYAYAGEDDGGRHRIGIIFMPSDWSLPLSTGFLMLCSFDLICLLTGRKFFDHAAHLGGAAAGAVWAWTAQSSIWIRLRDCWPVRVWVRFVVEEPQQPQQQQRQRQIVEGKPASTRI